MARIDELRYQAALTRLDARLGREIARLRARYQLSLDEFRGLYVSDEQVDRLLAETAQDAVAPSADNLAPLTAELARDAPWSRLASVFGLSTLEQDLVLLAMASELDLRYEVLYAYLNDDVTRKWPTANLAIRLLAGAGVSRGDVMRALGPSATLRASELVSVIDPPGARPSLLNAGFAASPVVSRFLQAIPLARAEPAQPEPAVEDWSELPFAAERIDYLRRLATLLARRGAESPVIVLSGPPGSGRTRACRAIVRAMGAPLRALDLSLPRRAGTAPAALVTALALELRLEPAALCVRGLATLVDHEGRVAPEARGLLADLPHLGLPTFIVAEPAVAWRDLLGPRRALVVHFGVPDFPERLGLWSRSLAVAGIHLPEGERRALADHFALTPAQIADAIAAARDRAEMGDGTGLSDGALLHEAAREQPRERLGAFATTVACQHGWSDLVLPPAALSRLREISAAIRLRHIVYGDWAFARRIASGSGVKALFAGASGTGKTMAAGVIAREVGLDLIKIDLSGLVSKYIGETEKNLDRVFASAQAGNTLLFFDEADALFGKRSEVKDAHDRYANIEMAYLLQKIEEHTGVVLLASNLRRNIDEAFLRRLHYVVDFPQPDVADRERLWRGMFPEEAPLAPDIDFAFLARQFELVGGDIRNVVLDAAFLAAEERGPIGMRQLVRAVHRQLMKQGKSPSWSDFQRYHHLIADHAASPDEGQPGVKAP